MSSSSRLRALRRKQIQERLDRSPANLVFYSSGFSFVLDASVMHTHSSWFDRCPPWSEKIHPNIWHKLFTILGALKSTNHTSDLSVCSTAPSLLQRVKLVHSLPPLDLDNTKKKELDPSLWIMWSGIHADGHTIELAFQLLPVAVEFHIEPVCNWCKVILRSYAVRVTELMQALVFMHTSGLMLLPAMANKNSDMFRVTTLIEKEWIRIFACLYSYDESEAWVMWDRGMRMRRPAYNPISLLVQTQPADVLRKLTKRFYRDTRWIHSSIQEWVAIQEEDEKEWKLVKITGLHIKTAHCLVVHAEGENVHHQSTCVPLWKLTDQEMVSLSKRHAHVLDLSQVDTKVLTEVCTSASPPSPQRVAIPTILKSRKRKSIPEQPSSSSPSSCLELLSVISSFCSRSGEEKTEKQQQHYRQQCESQAVLVDIVPSPCFGDTRGGGGGGGGLSWTQSDWEFYEHLQPIHSKRVAHIIDMIREFGLVSSTHLNILLEYINDLFFWIEVHCVVSTCPSISITENKRDLIQRVFPIREIELVSLFVACQRSIPPLSLYIWDRSWRIGGYKYEFFNKMVDQCEDSFLSLALQQTPRNFHQGCLGELVFLPLHNYKNTARKHFMRSLTFNGKTWTNAKTQDSSDKATRKKLRVMRLVGTSGGVRALLKGTYGNARVFNKKSFRFWWELTQEEQSQVL